MICGSIDLLEENGMFTLSLNGVDGVKRLGAGNDLKSFVENRLNSGMSSPELRAALLQLKELGEGNSWNFKAMSKTALA